MAGGDEFLSTDPMLAFPTYAVVSTSAVTGNYDLQAIVREAKEYVDRAVEEFYFHRVHCHYCWSMYEANLEIGYECPSCGARDYSIIEEVKRAIRADPDELVRSADVGAAQERASRASSVLG